MREGDLLSRLVNPGRPQKDERSVDSELDEIDLPLASFEKLKIITFKVIISFLLDKTTFRNRNADGDAESQASQHDLLFRIHH